MNELFILILFFVAGLSLVRLLAGEKYPIFNAVAAFPIGVLIWVIGYIISYFLPFPLHSPLPFNIHLTLTLFCLAIILFLSIGIYRTKLTWQEILIYPLSCIPLYLIYTLTSGLPLVFMTRDSFIWLDITLGFQASLQRGYPIFNQCVQGVSLLIHPDYVLTTIPQFFAASLTGIMAYVVFGEIGYQIHDRSFLYKLYVLILSFLPALLLFSPYMGTFQIFYHNHHMITATFLFLCAASFWFAIRTQTPAAIYIGILSLAACTLTRMEGLFNATVILPIFLSHPLISAKQQRKASVLFFCGITPWFLYVIYQLWGRAIHVTSREYMIILSLCAVVTLSFQINRWEQGKKLLHHFHRLIPLGGGLVFMLFLIFKTNRVQQAVLNNLSKNFFIDRYGAWGILWFFIFLSIPLLLIVRSKDSRSRNIDVILLSGITGILLIIDILCYRGFVRPGFTDSTNRIMFHFVPLLLVWIVIHIGFTLKKSILLKNYAKQQDHSRRHSRV